MARPKLEIDEHQLETLASIGCTLNEMAAFFKCSVDTISRNYADVLNRGRENGKTSVRRMMWEHGKKGNSVALKYLVHNILKEKVEEYNQPQEEAPEDEYVQQLRDVTDEKLIEYLKNKEKQKARE